MAGPTRPTPPSAIDGFRRLERTRNVAAAGHVPVATAVVPPRRRPLPTARVAGMARLAGFIAVLAIIIGTSVGLASADSRADARRDAARSTTTAEPTPAAAASVEREAPATVTKQSAPADAKASDAVPAAESSEPVETVAVAAAAESGAAPAATSAPSTASGALPFTGEPSLDRYLLIGAALVLLGMLMQIAGQPLPANRVPARTR